MMNYKIVPALSLLVGLSLFVGVGDSMATESVNSKMTFKDAKKGLKVSLFSAVQGMLLGQDEPLEGIKVERYYHFTWANKDYKEVTYTDAQGRFQFSEAVKSMFLGSFLPHEPVIPQKIRIYPQGMSQGVVIWQHTKRSYHSMDEFRGLDQYVLRSTAEQMTPVMQAYAQGKIALSCEITHIKDDVSDDADFQQVTPYTAIVSPCDLQLPYQTAVNQAKQTVALQLPEIKAALAAHLAGKAKVFETLKEPRFNGFQDLSFKAIESINFYDQLALRDHLQDYASNSFSIELSGEVILQMKNTRGKSVGIRLWLSDGVFRVTDKTITFIPSEWSLVFNEFNIDAEKDA